MITRLNASVEAQAAIMAGLKADAPLAALLPADSILPQQVAANPTRPFILLGVPIITPRYVQGGDCSDVSAAIHCYADPQPGHPDARIFTLDVASHIARIINEMDVVGIGNGISLAVYVQQIQVMQDGSASRWHSFVTFRAEAS